MSEIISATKIMDKRTVNYVVGGPYTLVIYDAKSKKVEHLFTDEIGLTEFALEGTDRGIGINAQRDIIHKFISDNKLTGTAEAEDLISDLK